RRGHIGSAEGRTGSSADSAAGPRSPRELRRLVMMAQHKTRNPKQIRSTKFEPVITNCLLVWYFPFRILDLFRISTFEFRISTSEQPLWRGRLEEAAMNKNTVSALKEASEGLLYMSETDEPFEVVHWGKAAGDLAGEVRRRAGAPAEAGMKEIALDKF